MKDYPNLIGWELRLPDGSGHQGILRRVMVIGEYVIIGEMSRTTDVRFMEYHVSVSLTEEAARDEAVRCTQVAEMQGYEMWFGPCWKELDQTAGQIVDYLTLKGGQHDKRGSMAPMFDALRVAGRSLDRIT